MHALTAASWAELGAQHALFSAAADAGLSTCCQACKTSLWLHGGQAGLSTCHGSASWLGLLASMTMPFYTALCKHLERQRPAGKGGSWPVALSLLRMSRCDTLILWVLGGLTILMDDTEQVHHEQSLDHSTAVQVAECVRHWPRGQAPHLSAQGQGCAAHNSAGAGQGYRQADHDGLSPCTMAATTCQDTAWLRSRSRETAPSLPACRVGSSAGQGVRIEVLPQ